MNFIRMNLPQLRVEMYQGLMDHIVTAAENQGRQPGKIVILPSSFQGYPRSCQQNDQDAMAIVAKYEKPDLFLTFTCNPKCKDITDASEPEQQSGDRSIQITCTHSRYKCVQCHPNVKSCCFPTISHNVYH